MEERRHAVRYPCDGSVELQQGDEKSRLWGHLGDISTIGFYMSTFATWAVHTQARFKIEVGNIEIQGIAAVATAYPGVGMGCSFVEIFPEFKPKLEAIIESLKSASGGAPSSSFTIER